MPRVYYMSAHSGVSLIRMRTEIHWTLSLIWHYTRQRRKLQRGLGFWKGKNGVSELAEKSGTLMANKTLLGNPERVGHTGDLANRTLRGIFLSSTEVNMLRFHSWSRPFYINLLNRKGDGLKVLSESCLLTSLKINTPKGTSLKWKNFVPLQDQCPMLWTQYSSIIKSSSTALHALCSALFVPPLPNS